MRHKKRGTYLFFGYMPSFYIISDFGMEVKRRLRDRIYSRFSKMISHMR